MTNTAGSYVLVISLAMLGVLCACSERVEYPNEATQNDNPENHLYAGIEPDSALAVVTDRQSIPGSPSINSNPTYSEAQVRFVQSALRNSLDTFRWQVIKDNPSEGTQLRALLDEIGLSDEDAFPVVQELLMSIGNITEKDRELRLALLDLLFSFDLAGVDDFAFELLRNDSDLLELSKLGLYLEREEPGVYTETIRLTAEQFLSESDPPGQIPGEFFQLLGRVGNESTMALLQDLPLHMNAYSSVAFALIEDGSGIRQLEQDARLFKTGVDSNQGRLAIELLAQEAYRQDSAAEALFELALESLIPDDMWLEVATFLAGGKEITLEQPEVGLLATNTIYRPEGNQVVYTVATSPLQETPEQIDRRIYLVGELQTLAPPELGHYFIAAETNLVQLRRRVSVNELSGE